jgi:hypothetical protein
MQGLIRPAIFLAKQMLPDPKNGPVEVVNQEKHDSILTHYSQVPRETGSTLFQPQLNSKGCYTSAYIRKPVEEFDAKYFPGQQSLH